MRGGRTLTLLAGVLAFGSGLLAAPAQARPAGPAGDGRPNILVVMTDDMNRSDLQFMPKTRRLLAKQGTTFTMRLPAKTGAPTGQEHTAVVEKPLPVVPGTISSPQPS